MIYNRRFSNQQGALKEPYKEAARGPLWPHIIVAIFATLSAFTIKITGTFYFSEIFALLFLPFVQPLRAIGKYRSLRLIVFGYVLILLGLIISDFINKTQINDWSRGWLSVIIAINTTIFLVSVISKNHKSIITLILFMFFSMLIFGNASYALRGNELELSLASALNEDNFFKIRFIPFLVPLLMIFMIYFAKKSLFINYIILFSFLILFLYFDARSVSIMILLTILGIYIKSKKIKFNFIKSIPIILMLAIIGQIFYSVYVYYSINSNSSGHNATQLEAIDNPYNPFYLLVQGRTETFVALKAISDKPIFGFGSWARDPSGIYIEEVEILKNSNANVKYDEIDYIPSHSVILGYWLWGGILSFIGSLLILREVVITGIKAVNAPSIFSTCIIFIVSGFLWDMLFSPIGSIRIGFPQAISIIIVIAYLYRKPDKMGGI
jgi:hypothetical protein